MNNWKIGLLVIGAITLIFILRNADYVSPKQKTPPSSSARRSENGSAGIEDSIWKALETLSAMSGRLEVCGDPTARKKLEDLLESVVDWHFKTQRTKVTRAEYRSKKTIPIWSSFFASKSEPCKGSLEISAYKRASEAAIQAIYGHLQDP